jgi:hypothetical protein
MINEEELWYKRGDLVEFKLTLGGGPRRCRGVVLNTAVLYGRAARQIWVLDMDDATPELNARWTNRLTRRLSFPRAMWCPSFRASP